MSRLKLLALAGLALLTVIAWTPRPDDGPAGQTHCQHGSGPGDAGTPGCTAPCDMGQCSASPCGAFPVLILGQQAAPMGAMPAVLSLFPAARPIPSDRTPPPPTPPPDLLPG